MFLSTTFIPSGFMRAEISLRFARKRTEPVSAIMNVTRRFSLVFAEPASSRLTEPDRFALSVVSPNVARKVLRELCRDCQGFRGSPVLRPPVGPNQLDHRW